MTAKRYSHDAIVIVDHLKKDLIYIDGKDELLELAEYVDRLQYENEQLKKENMEYYQLVNCGNCKYHNYDWFDDGDEFEVCEKGHTERLMYNQFCKEWKEL